VLTFVCVIRTSSGFAERAGRHSYPKAGGNADYIGFLRQLLSNVAAEVDWCCGCDRPCDTFIPFRRPMSVENSKISDKGKLVWSL